MLCFDPEDQAVLSPALNTALCFRQTPGTGIRPRERLLDRIFPDFLLDLPLGGRCILALSSRRSVRHKRPVGRERNCYERTSHSLESPGSGPPPGREPGGPRRGGGNRDRRGGPQTLADTAASYAAQYGGAQSLQYALWQDGEIVLTGQTGTFSRSENRLMTGDELYGIGSVSKIYTTVAVMQLAEDGQGVSGRPG